MPSISYSDDDDPVVASYDVYITQPRKNESPSSTSSSNVYVLQYPSHRALSKPYNTARSQKPRALRWKPQSGVIEVDIPILTNENYNEGVGVKYGRAMADSRINQSGGSHGLSGGFGNGPSQSHNINLYDIPDYGESQDPQLQTQTLGGKMVTSSSKDPVYMLGSFRNNELHLTHLNGVVQMRPQLHHIDAEEEINQKKSSTAVTGPGGKQKPGLEAPPGKLETKAIELKLKDNKEDGMKDRNLNSNAKLLRDIQMEDFKVHTWVDQNDQSSKDKFARIMRPESSAGSRSHLVVPSGTKLKSVLDNDEWLDKMSSPAIELRTRLKGRDRERARRKRQERSKFTRVAIGNPPTTATLDRGSESEDSTSDEEEGVEDETSAPSGMPKEAEIKQDPEASAADSAATPRKRGRPKKAMPVDTST